MGRKLVSEKTFVSDGKPNLNIKVYTNDVCADTIVVNGKTHELKESIDFLKVILGYITPEHKPVTAV